MLFCAGALQFMIRARVIKQGLARMFRNGRTNAAFYFFAIYNNKHIRRVFLLDFSSVRLLVYLQLGIRFTLFPLQIFTFEGDQHLIIFFCFLFDLFFYRKEI